MLMLCMDFVPLQFTSCGCVDSPSSVLYSSVAEKCERQCVMLYVFLVLVFYIITLTMMAGISIVQIMLRYMGRFKMVGNTCGGEYIWWGIHVVGNTCGGEYMWWGIHVVGITCGGEYMWWGIHVGITCGGEYMWWGIHVVGNTCGGEYM